MATRLEERIAVKRGQRYRIRRAGKAARHIEIASVSRGQSAKGMQPVARYFEITRSGTRKGRRRIVIARNLDGSPKQTGPNLVSHWLTWDPTAAAWSMGPGFEVVS